ncbi:V-set and immunoglobulin domain-containing protein 1-like [Astyanax mexicanus]|uniref:V-set and immunoglobulin domain-containing protein 1-like n=1 Tax=Astyanax mexicanus TaxID=7994 RepID=UPI0020CB2610|nr:V-set and immunoglobulin domain-containing protein 1-like [Astyanax mexicanus]
MMTLSVTLCITVLLSQYSTVTAGVVMKNQGESLTMTCTTTKNSNNIGLYLKARRPEKCELFYYANTKDSAASYGSAYEGRVTVSGEIEKLTVKITDLQKEDSGFYFCQYVLVNGAKFESNETDSLLLFVKEVENIVTTAASTGNLHDSPNVMVLVSILTACTVALLCYPR